jgi:hypothetical protein
MYIWHALTAGELPHYAIHPLPFCFKTPTCKLAPSILSTAGGLLRLFPHPHSNHFPHPHSNHFPHPHSNHFPHPHSNHFPRHLSNRQANCRLSLSSCKSFALRFSSSCCDAALSPPPSTCACWLSLSLSLREQSKTCPYKMLDA